VKFGIYEHTVGVNCTRNLAPINQVGGFMGPLNSIFGQNLKKIVISTPNVTHLDQCKDVGVMAMQLIYRIIYNNLQ